MIIKIQHNGSNNKDLKTVCDYISNPKNEHDPDRCEMLATSRNDINNSFKNLALQSFILDVETNHNLHLLLEKKKSENKFLYDHIEIAFSSEDWKNRTNQEMLEIAKEGLQGFIKDFDDKDFLYTLHNDTEHKHFHFIVPRVSNSLSYDHAWQSKNRSRQVAEDLEDKYDLVKTNRQDSSPQDPANKLQAIAKKAFNANDLEASAKLEELAAQRQKELETNPFEFMKKQTVYAANNAKNKTHFFKLLDKHNIQIKPSFKQGSDEQKEIRGFSFEMRSKQGEVIAHASGSKLNRKLLTKNALESRFNGITSQIIQRQEQKQTTPKTVKNNAQTVKQAASMSNKSVKKPSSSHVSNLPQKENEIDKFGDAETKMIQQYNKQKMADYDEREAKRRAEQNEQKDSIFKLFVDDYKELKEKESSRLSRSEQELEKALIEESSFISEEPKKPIKSTKKAIDLDNKKSVSWFSNLTKPSEEKYKKLLESGFDLTTSKLPQAWNDKENAYKITNFMSDNKGLLSQKEKEHLFNNLKKNEVSDEILSRAYKDFEPSDEAQKKERDRLLNKFKNQSNDLASQYQSANRKPLHSSNKQVSTSVLKKKKDKKKKDRNKLKNTA
ncbi:relaxase/mobilization nuclease domain-containing protein [Vibrio parahaemolyticus]|uniref:relaxase/mobilization nuclease domain-containing protein n=1 Tax=Vibrio parahaemolyticus TaxID=670 RepID=UPI00215B9926|nr:relaxase/mobilization nuclease domain-containing protein [Vibrio parahaemolyticus]MCR9855886.1 relaxase/mobilization nuclease domain-containing protein [Vibrio parahaemolyticus]MDG2608902.1 relaxase/mobilization nuclease domain-containing protein [Vibrio parahaemolyticus]